MYLTDSTQPTSNGSGRARPKRVATGCRAEWGLGAPPKELVENGYVGAVAFYEWQRMDARSKKPFAIALTSGEPFAFAGLWESWRPKNGEPLETFTILTTDPNEVMAPIHNRMPVILEPKNYDRWLDAGDQARPPVDLLRPYPAEQMRAWPVSDRVGNVRNNDPQLLEPTP